MKGDFFNLLEKFVVKNFGEVAFEKVYMNAWPHFSHRGPFLGTEIYPDSDFFSLLAAAISQIGISLETAQYEFGKFCFPVLWDKLPKESRQFNSAKELLMSIHSTIHVEVKKLHAKASPPNFEYIDPAPDELVMIYKSPRKLFWLVEGLIAGCAEHFNQRIEIARRTIDQGNACEYHLKFK
jgi:hypothetical protein